MLGKRKTKTGNESLGFLATITDCSEGDLDEPPSMILAKSTQLNYLVKRMKLNENNETVVN